MNDNTNELIRRFLGESWREARDGLLARTETIRILPLPSETPACFRFEIHRPFKRKTSRGAAVELVKGPLFGTILYRRDQLAREGSSIAVFLDPEQAFFHPNACRRTGVLCVGDLPPFFPLEATLEHIFGIISYQNRAPDEPLDFEAARYFALDPDCMEGLEPVEPLY